MKPIYSFFIASALVLTGCAAPKPLPPPPPLQLATPSNEQKAAILNAILSSLKDPDSAKFGRIGMLSNSKAACVEVNAKNAFGGYTGFQTAALVGDPEIGWASPKISKIDFEKCLEVLRRFQ